MTYLHEEKPSFLDFENNWLQSDRRTDERTDGRTARPSYRDARMHLKTRKIVTFKQMSARAGLLSLLDAL